MVGPHLLWCLLSQHVRVHRGGDMTYPAAHFPGTPPLGIWAIKEGIRWAGVQESKWLIPLEVIARYESGFNPYVVSKVCPDCRGMMQQSVGQYGAYGVSADYTSPVEAVECAIRYIRGRLRGYGGYGNLGTIDGKLGLLPRTDRGPGNVLRAWVEHPDWGVSKLREFYRGY